MHYSERIIDRLIEDAAWGKNDAGDVYGWVAGFRLKVNICPRSRYIGIELDGKIVGDIDGREYEFDIGEAVKRLKAIARWRRQVPDFRKG